MYSFASASKLLHLKAQVLLDEGLETATPRELQVVLHDRFVKLANLQSHGFKVFVQSKLVETRKQRKTLEGEDRSTDKCSAPPQHTCGDLEALRCS